MPERYIEFDAESILQLLVHYTQDHEDRVPLDAQLLSAGVSAFIPRWVMLEAKSENEWKDIPIDTTLKEPAPLHVRFEGRKTMSWGQDKTAPITWSDTIESPKAT